jgi:hypothetical protein
MMGYLPSRFQAYNGLYIAKSQKGDKTYEYVKEDTTKIFEGQGEVFRYAKQGENLDPEQRSYSEIGFYTGVAQWPLVAEKEATDKPPEFPRIDVVNIDSTGNMRKTAVNHHLQKAARMEILVDAPEVLDRKTCAVDEQGSLPLGDNVGDDSGLHRGDLHVRAGGRVIIKASDEIRLQVGRTILRIDDSGFNVISKNMNGNWLNTADASINMSPRGGISLTGKKIKASAGYQINLGDGMGGSFASTLGAVIVNGRQVDINSHNNLEYSFFALYQGLEYLLNTTSSSFALAGSDNVEIADYMKFATDSLKSLIQLAKKVNKIWGDRKKNHELLVKERENKAKARQDVQRAEEVEARRAARKAEEDRLLEEEKLANEQEERDSAELKRTSDEKNAQLIGDLENQFSFFDDDDDMWANEDTSEDDDS